MGGKFARGNSKHVQPFESFVDSCEAWKGVDLSTGYMVDRAADDIYLKKIRDNRGSVKSMGINDPMTRSAIDYRTQMAVGTSVRIKPNIMWERLGWSEQENRDVRRQAKETWKIHMESDERWSDAAGLHTISEQAGQHARIFQTEGEAMAAVYELPAARRSPLSFNLGNINPDRVRTPVDRSTPDELLNIHEGKLTSRRGYPLGYYVHDYARRDSRRVMAGSDDPYQFIPTRNRDTGREQFIHSYVQVTSDLSRGISKLASCMTLSCQKDKYTDAVIEDAISKAGLTFVIKSNAANLEDLMGVLSNDNASHLQQYMQESYAWHQKMNIQHKGNKVARLLHGEDLEGFSANQAGGSTMGTLNEVVDTIAASCHGLSVEEYRQRWNDTNYSGARSGKLYVANMIKQLRADAPWRFVRKAYCLFFEDMVLQGKIRLPGFDNPVDAWRYFLDHKAELTCVEFFGSPKDEIDRAKTADGYLAEGQLGVATWESYCNEVLGVDWEDRLDQIIEEVKTIYQKLVNCGATPTWTIEDMVSHRLFAGNAFLARKELRESGSLNDPDGVVT